VKTVVLVEDVKDALTLLAREAEEVQSGIIHAEERGEGTSFGITKEVGMRRLTVAVGAGKQVEVMVGAVKIGIDADEATEVHEESEMEIAHRSG